MKRGLLLIILFTCSYFSFAQESYYHIEIVGYIDEAGSCGSVKGLKLIEITYTDNSKEELFKGTKEKEDFYFDKKIYGNKKVRSIYIESKRQTDNLFGCNNSDDTGITEDIDGATCISRRNNEAFGKTNGWYEIKITPKIEILDPGSPAYLTSDELINIGVPISNVRNQYFNWIYSKNGGTTWSSLPSRFQRDNYINIQGDDFLNDSDHGKTISFMVNTQCDNSKSNIISYNYLISAPHIISSNVTGLRCYDTDDGEITIVLDRPLKVGEKLSATLTNLDTGSTGGGVEEISLDTNNSFSINGIVGGRYSIDLLGFYNGFNTYTDGRKHQVIFTIIKPTPVEFSTTGYSDVICYGESNGTISIQATGGTNGGYEYQLIKDGANPTGWTGFSSTNSTVISGLPQGEYGIRVRDANACLAKEIVEDDFGGIIGLGDVKEEFTTIIQPLPFEASLIQLEIKEPRAYGFTDGVIAINVTGGNHNNSGYTITWYKDGSEMTSPNVTSTTAGKDDSFVYTERLLNIGEGNYTAKITDSKGCETSIAHVLTQPEPLELKLSVETPISCNTGSTDSFTKTEDGHLIAIATGGVGKYIFTWKKMENGVWETLYTSPTPEAQSSTTEFTSGIGAGTYAVNVKDENGIVIGEYINNTLVKLVDEELIFEEPDPIVISIASLDVFCRGGNNAWIEAAVEGGTLRPGEDYSYQWSNGQTTNRIENLIAGEYILTVTDSNGCFEIVSVVIEEPKEELQIELFSYKQPKANGLTDGYIQYKVTGGTPFDSLKYNYQCTDESGNNLNSQVSDSLGTNGYYIKLSNIAKGTYFVTVTDANYSKTTSNIACIVTTDYFLNEPEPLELYVEETKVISCNTLNDYGNPFSDGAVTAHAVGGVKLQPNENNGLPYYYTWKKRDGQGDWQELSSQTDSTAINLDAGEYAVNIKDANGVILGTYGMDNQLEEAIDTLYTLKEPPLLEISTTQQNVYCFAGSDAWAEVQITGGVAPYTVAWSNGDTTERATALSVGTYQVHVIDYRGCEAITEVIITEPDAPVAISYSQFNRPTHIGANDAWIEAVVTGGTSLVDGTYDYFWKDEDGKLLNGQTTAEVVNDTYVLRLNTITAGTYYLTVQDKNYDIATTKAGCTHSESAFVIYEPIEATIAIETPISCNTNNEYQDPFSDGALVAHIEGGVPFETGLPYIYQWKKQNEAGVWEDLTDQLDSIAVNLNDGNYALNVEDSKGTVMGTYRSDNLIKAVDSTFYFKEPDLLEVSFTTTEVNCDAGNDGSAMVHITGGIPPYDIKWSNGETTQEVSNLIGGTYFVFVTDSRGCEISANVVVAQPGGLQLEVVTQKNPTCFEGNDGAISVNVTGGLPPYQYQWNTGVATNSISELSKGKYTLRIIDNQGCIAYKEVVLEDPEPIIVNLGEDRSLCNGQEALFDVTIDDTGARYYWESDNGFTSTDPSVTLSKEGVYTVTVTSALGCIGTDQIEIKESNVAIDADFLITSQAFVDEEVVLVNVSSPLGAGTEWHVPDGVTIVSQSSEAAILKFKEVGSYEIRLRTIEGDCYQDYTKQIVVQEPTGLIDIGEAEQPFLKKFVVHPNPSYGNFTVEILLSETADLSLRMIDLLTANISDTRLLINSDTYSEYYSVTVASGVYILLLETPKGNEVRRVIIK